MTEPPHAPPAAPSEGVALTNPDLAPTPDAARIAVAAYAALMRAERREVA